MHVSAVLFLAAVAAASAAGAQERYDLGRKTLSRVDDVATHTTLSSARLIMAGSSPGESPRDFRRYLSTRAVSVERCLEVDREGNATKVLVHIRNWVEQRGDTETALTDTAIQGASIFVTGHGRDRAWRFVGEAPELTEGARQWLDANFGAARPIAALVEAMFPRHKVAVAESWEADPSPLLERITQHPVTAATGKGTLLNVDQGNARIHFSFTVSSGGMPFGPRGIVVPWKSGGTMRVTLEATVALGGARTVTVSQYRSVIDGVIDASSTDGALHVSVDSHLAHLQTISEGGAMPPTLP